MKALIAIIFIHMALRFSPYPDFNRFKERERSVRFYDKNGILLQASSVQNGLRREWTDWNKIPKKVKKAFLKAEDRRFFFHLGVDPFSAAAAAIQNARAKRTVRGASTITMQLVKMAAPNGSRSMAKKIGEVLDALRIEARLSKKKIFELYLNSVPFGQNCEGVTSAARTFFGKELADLSDQEIACLAVIPRRPGGYNPIQNPEACAKRAAEVFGLDYDSLLERAKSAGKFRYPFEMPHYIERVKKEIKAKKFVPEIRLSASLEVQKTAERYIKEAAKLARGSRIANSALLLIDNKDRSVLAWVGNSDWFDFSHSGQVDGVLSKIQPGSSMKPFLYGLAFDTLDKDGKALFTPATVLADVPQEFGGQKIYIPENFNNRFNGPVRLRVALASSLNVPAVYVLDALGVDKYLLKLEELGFESLRSGGRDKDLGLALGAGQVTLFELVRAFSVWTGDGRDASGKQIYSKDTARLICSILSDKDARALGFGYNQVFQTEYPSIFKTGTSNQYQNITALGSTKRYTIGVWMGNFSGQTVMGKTGSSLPAWVAKNVLDFLELKNPGHKGFPAPQNWVKAKICPLSGMLAVKDCQNFVFEYVPKEHIPDPCDWHKTEGGQRTTTYPAEYQRWLLSAKKEAQVDHSSTPLTIVTPRQGSVFYRHPSDSMTQFEAIAVEAIGGDQDTAQVYYDDGLAFTIERPFVFTLPTQKGKKTCKIVCGGQSAQVDFEIR
ncbi:MAG: transglycosylase domain-containing protein [Treponema sp.]|nr:transglycosylase domain-containing protein [Treponema sp.]